MEDRLKNQPRILLINDMAGYGKVALSVMIPVFSHMKYETFNLPTVLISNTLDYGNFDILDTTEYMQNTLRVWNEPSVQVLLYLKDKPHLYMNIVKNKEKKVRLCSLTQSWGMMGNAITE